MLKILHLAPLNFAGVPYSFYEMHNELGDISRLITYHKNKLDFPEDICLDFPLPDFTIAKNWRRKKAAEIQSLQNTKSPFFEPHNYLENLYYQFNDLYKKSRVEKIKQTLDLDSFHIIHYDGGLDFYRNSSQAVKWKSEGKKIVCCYYGSDLRSRGLIKEMDQISDLNITSEFDHLSLKDDLHYLFYPYNPSELPQKKENAGKVRVIHSPTNRLYKGTDLILKVVESLKKELSYEFILLENVSREVVLQEKVLADICIDQVGGTMGGTGYGKAGLESLAMGIPTITNMTDEYSKWLTENPFIVANNGDELYEELRSLILDADKRMKLGVAGKNWVNRYHGYDAVNKKLKELYRLKNII